MSDNMRDDGKQIQHPDHVVSWLTDLPLTKSRGTIGDWIKKTLIKTYIQYAAKSDNKIYSVRLFGQYKAENEDKIIDAVKEFFPIDWADHSCQMYEENVTFYLSDTNGVVALDMDREDKALSINYATNVEDIHRHLQEKLKKLVFKRPKENEGKVYVLASDSSGLSTTELGIGGVALEMDNYSKETHEDIKTVIQDLKSPIPQGRLIILEGTPGTGKTFFIRSLISQVPKAFFVVIPPAMMKNLGDPSIIPVLLDLKSDYGRSDEKENERSGPVVLIAEDADECLCKRGVDNMSSISSILNFTSGILGDLLDIRIITTTNAQRTDFDEALTRSGRISSFIHIGELGRQEAAAVYRRIMGDNTLDYDGSTLLADIYSLAKKVKKNLGEIEEKPVETRTTKPSTAKNKLKKYRKIGF
jgi:hypothetical protein